MLLLLLRQHLFMKCHIYRAPNQPDVSKQNTNNNNSKLNTYTSITIRLSHFQDSSDLIGVCSCSNYSFRCVSCSPAPGKTCFDSINFVQFQFALNIYAKIIQASCYSRYIINKFLLFTVTAQIR